MRLPLFLRTLCLMTCAALLLLTTSEGRAQSTPDIRPALSTPIFAGQKKIKARVHQLGDWTLHIKDRNNADDGQVTATATNDNGGALTFDLTDKLKNDKKELQEGWTVELTPPATLTPAQQAALKADTTVVKNEVSIVVNPVHEGDDVVEGTVRGSADRVRVQVLSPQGKIVNTDESAVSGGAYSSGLSRRLVEGYTVLVLALKDGEPIGASDYTSVLSVGFNWGRVRAYFSAGATVATMDKTTVSDPSVSSVTGGTATTTTTTRKREFSSADYFIGLNLDFTVYTSLRNRPANSCARPARDVEDLEQLEALVSEWNGHNFKKRMKTLPDDQQKVERAEGVLAEAIKALNSIVSNLDSSQNGAGCSSTEKARSAILKAGIRRLSKSEGVFAGFAKTLLSAPDTNLNSKNSGGPTLQETIDAVDDALQALRHDINDFRKSDPASPTQGRLFNTSFDARLGQAPVSAQGSVTAGAAGIVQRPNSAYLATEIYAPLWSQGMAWMHDNKENALFIAPLIRTGLLATDIGPIAEKVVETETGGVKTTTKSGSSDLFRHVFPFTSFGARFGHFAVSPKRRDVAPELISYLDFTYGRFDNFRLPRVLNATESTVPPSVNDEIPWRFEVHGRFKIPETPLYVGFTGNVGHGPDDLRFFFGTRFDFSKAMARILSRQ